RSSRRTKTVVKHLNTNAKSRNKISSRCSVPLVFLGSDAKYLRKCRFEVKADADFGRLAVTKLTGVSRARFYCQGVENQRPGFRGASVTGGGKSNAGNSLTQPIDNNERSWSE